MMTQESTSQKPATIQSVLQIYQHMLFLNVLVSITTYLYYIIDIISRNNYVNSFNITFLSYYIYHTQNNRLFFLFVALHITSLSWRVI